jgi:hypothetical protein
MRYGFVKDHLPPNRYAGSAEFFQVLVDFVSRFTQLKTDLLHACRFKSNQQTPKRPDSGHPLPVQNNSSVQTHQIFNHWWARFTPIPQHFFARFQSQHLLYLPKHMLIVRIGLMN